MKDIIFFINNHILLSLIWIFLLFLIILSTIKDFFSKIKVINSFKAITLINKKKALVIDTRSLKLFRLGHIVNSIHMPLNNFCLTTIKDIELNRSYPIILISNKSNNYQKLTQFFLKQGFNDIYILKNGVYDWNLENLPLIVHQDNKKNNIN